MAQAVSFGQILSETSPCGICGWSGSGTGYSLSTLGFLSVTFNQFAMLTNEHSQLAEVQQWITIVLHSTVHIYLLWTTPSSRTRVILVASCGERANACFCIFFNSPLTKYHISWTPFTILRLICSYCAFGSSWGSEKLCWVSFVTWTENLQRLKN